MRKNFVIEPKACRIEQILEEDCENGTPGSTKDAKRIPKLTNQNSIFSQAATERGKDSQKRHPIRVLSSDKKRNKTKGMTEMQASLKQPHSSDLVTSPSDKVESRSRTFSPINHQHSRASIDDTIRAENTD